MKQLIFVFLGGGLGSLFRYVVNRWMATADGQFPFGTFTANILGSLLIGIILGYSIKNESLTQDQTLFLATGFCGGFTTFSTFAYENYQFLKLGDFSSFAIYAIASFSLGILAVMLGLYFSKMM